MEHGNRLPYMAVGCWGQEKNMKGGGGGSITLLKENLILKRFEPLFLHQIKQICIERQRFTLLGAVKGSKRFLLSEWEKEKDWCKGEENLEHFVFLNWETRIKILICREKIPAIFYTKSCVAFKVEEKREFD